MNRFLDGWSGGCDGKGESFLSRHLPDAGHVLVLGILVATANNAVVRDRDMGRICYILHKKVPSIGEVADIPKELH